MLVVIALGGNALLQRGEPLDADVQRRNVRVAAKAIAAVARRHIVVVTHGNGPQVGLLALQSEQQEVAKPYPLDVLGAEAEGMIGYVIEQELRNELGNREVCTLLTQVVVEANDPAFGRPTKPIGPFYDEAQAKRLARIRGWTVGRDGDAFRRLVPSPQPQSIIELPTIQLLLEHSVIVICAGGGGIPVTVRYGAIRGVEAVIDKDRAAALLASLLGADALLMLTDVPHVWLDWPRPCSRAVVEASPDMLQRHSFSEGSMKPKVSAACNFAKEGGFAAIGALSDVSGLLCGSCGTRVRPGTNTLVLADHA